MRRVAFVSVFALLACSNGSIMDQPDLAGAPADLPMGAGDLASADLAMTGGGAERLLGGSSPESGYFAVASPDGHLYVLGLTRSANGDLTGIKSTVDNDLWLIKLDGTLAIVWSRVYGGNGNNRPYGLELAADGDVLVLAEIEEAGKQVTTAYGGTDAWLAKIDPSNGDLRWEKTFGGTSDDRPAAVRETVLAGNAGFEYTVVGYTKSSTSGNVVENTSGFTDAMIGRYVIGGTAPTPNPQATTFGGNGTETAIGFIGDSIVGITDSTMGADIGGTTARGWNDIYIQPPSGTMIRFGGNQHDQITRLLPDMEHDFRNFILP